MELVHLDREGATYNHLLVLLNFKALIGEMMGSGWLSLLLPLLVQDFLR